MTKSITVFSSEFESENGQAVVTRKVVREVLRDIGEVNECVYEAGARPSSFLSWVAASLRLQRKMLFPDSKTVYVVCSRTFPGFVRDLPGLLLAFLGKRVVVHCHGSDFAEFLTRGRLACLKRFVYRRCEVVIPCRHLALQVEDLVRKAHVCENFYDGVAQPLRPTDGLLVVWNSNVMASKGFFDVIETISDLNRAGCSISLLSFGKILGDEEMSAIEVRGAMQPYLNSPWFTYLGLIDHARAINALHDCDAVALPSRYRSEMQPLAIIEAMCAAKHIVVSNSPSLQVTVGDYPADFVPANDKGELARSLERLYCLKRSDPAAFSVANSAAAATARVRFSSNRFAAEMAQILSD